MAVGVEEEGVAALRSRAWPATVWRPASRRKAARRTRGRRSSGGVAREEEGTWGRAARARAVAGDGEDEDARWPALGQPGGAVLVNGGLQICPGRSHRPGSPGYIPPPLLSRLVAKTGTKGGGLLSRF